MALGAIFAYMQAPTPILRILCICAAILIMPWPMQALPTATARVSTFELDACGVRFNRKHLPLQSSYKAWRRFLGKPSAKHFVAEKWLTHSAWKQYGIVIALKRKGPFFYGDDIQSVSFHITQKSYHSDIREVLPGPFPSLILQGLPLDSTTQLDAIHAARLQKGLQPFALANPGENWFHHFSTTTQKMRYYYSYCVFEEESCIKGLYFAWQLVFDLDGHIKALAIHFYY